MKDYSNDPHGFAKDILGLPSTPLVPSLDLSKPFRIMNGTELYLAEKREAHRLFLKMLKAMGVPFAVVTYKKSP